MSIFKNNSIDNHFDAPNTGNPDFPGFVEAYLSEEDAKRVAKLLGKKDEGNPSTPDIDLESAMSDEEKEILEAVEEERLDPLKRIISWAKKYNLGNEDWVETYFEFNDDGSVACHTGLYLNSMTEPDFPESIKYVNGYLSLDGLTSAEGLELPKIIEGDLFLNGLTSAEGLKLPDEIGGYLSLNGLTSAKGLELPKIIEGGLYLNGLTSAKGLNLPDKIKWDLSLNKLTSAVGLKLPKEIEGDLYLNGLTSAEGLELPYYLNCLELNGLTSTKDLNLPEKIGGYLSLDGLTSTVGLELPKEIEGSLFLNGLTSTVGLDLTNITVLGYIHLEKIPDHEKQELCKKYPNLNIS